MAALIRLKRSRSGNVNGLILCSQASRAVSLWLVRHSLLSDSLWGLLPERVWAISIARLRTLLPVYLRPIDVIVFDGPYMEILS